MNSIAALANIGRTITPQEVERDARIVTEFVDYFRWLAEQDTGFKITVGQVWELYHECVILCRYWSEVCEEVGLPVREDWT